MTTAARCALCLATRRRTVRVLGATPTDGAGDDRGRKYSPRYYPTPSEARLLALLDRPRHGSELGPLLGVTRERVRQLIASLLEHDVIRSGDPVHAVSVIARKDDPSLLLSMEQERLLNRFPDAEATRLSRIANLGHIPLGRIARIADALCAVELIETIGASAGSRALATIRRRDQGRASACASPAGSVGSRAQRIGGSGEPWADAHLRHRAAAGYCVSVAQCAHAVLEAQAPGAERDRRVAGTVCVDR